MMVFILIMSLSQTRLVLRKALEKAAEKPAFSLKSKVAFLKLKFWERS
jgi:hypothetical protein